MFLLPDASDQNAILEPSGENAGERCVEASLVSWTTFDPSESITKIWRSPVRSESKAIWSPPGDQAGSQLSAVGRLETSLVPPVSGLMAMIRHPAGKPFKVARISGCSWARRNDAALSKTRSTPPRTRNRLEDDRRPVPTDNVLLSLLIDSSCTKQFSCCGSCTKASHSNANPADNRVLS